MPTSPRASSRAATSDAFAIAANDQLKVADQYKPLIVAYRNGAPVRLDRCCRRHRFAWRTSATPALSNGKPAVLMIIFRQPGANIIDTVDRMRAAAAAASRPRSRRPSKLSVVIDRTTTIRASVHDVEFTLMIAVVLVMLVVFVFLRERCAPPSFPASRCRFR